MVGAECHPRALCVAQHCSEREHLNDDLHIVTLPQELIVAARRNPRICSPAGQEDRSWKIASRLTCTKASPTCA
jgi:hypothetical protein